MIGLIRSLAVDHFGELCVELALIKLLIKQLVAGCKSVCGTSQASRERSPLPLR